MAKDIKKTKKGKMMVKGKNRYIRFDWAAKYMLRSKADFAIFEGLINVLIGEKIEIVFNPSYVKDPLKAIDEDEITIELTSGSTPAVIRCSVPFLYVMMPLRIN